MRPGIALSCGALLVFLLAGCGQSADDPETRHRFMAMGTLVDVTFWDVPPAEAEAAAAEIEALFHTLHHEWDAWGDGALGRLNAALAAGEAVLPDGDLAVLLEQAAALSAASDGLFDPAIGALVELWGFARQEDLPDAPPPPEKIAAQLAARMPLPRMMHANGHLSGPAGARIDLGGFAKGIAVDRGIALLRARGVEHAIINAGGDLRAIGRRGERAWRIGIRAPRGNRVLAALEIVDDEAVFTSGDYERFFDHQGRRYHHILDPRDGYPAQGLVSVTVLHREAGRADAAATALMVAGPDGWRSMAAALDVEAVMVVRDDGTIDLTDAMQSYATLLP